MNLFSFFNNKKKKDTFQISESERQWVEDTFRNFIIVFGHPYQEGVQILISDDYFPKTFNSDKVLIENIINDLCRLLQIKEENVSFEVVYDIRDSYNVPYQIEGKPFETKLDAVEGKYKIYLANSLQKHPKRLIYRLVYELLKIKLTASELKYDIEDGIEIPLFLAGIYFGFGVLLSQNLSETGIVVEGEWETKWNYTSEIPYEIIGFALAIYAKLYNEVLPIWRENLPSDVYSQFEKAIKYLNDNPSTLYDKKELEAIKLLKTAESLYLKNNFEDAILNLQKVLLLTNIDTNKALFYNNLGYYNIRLKKYEQALIYLKQSINITSDFGYANDNVGYALIQLGRLEEGKAFLEKALKTKNNDIAYSYRNFALYYQAKGDVNQASDYFKKSFASIKIPVDLLEYHYADFLMQIGETEIGLQFLLLAVEKGEPEAIERMKEMNKNLK